MIRETERELASTVASEPKRNGVFASFLKGLGLVLQTPGLFLSKDSANYYRFLGDDVVEGRDEGFAGPPKPLWLNLGYWRSARTYPEAARAMACLLGDAAELGAGDEVLDVGFGYAEQDFLWLERYGVKHISGLNITPLHVERARARVSERGLEAQMDLRQGSATEMPFEESSFDKVTALECAFHFDTRERFFDEAFRVLRPGGKLALADGMPWPGGGPLTLVNRLALKRWSVPPVNMYDRNEYANKLRAHGFVDITCLSIRNYVFPGATKYRKLRESGRSMGQAIVELTDDEVEQCSGIAEWALTGFTDYAIITAEKPLPRPNGERA